MGDCPAWYTPSKERPRCNLRVLRGLHPLGMELGPEGSTCGSCAHLTKRYLAKNYIKCDLVLTRSAATDVRKKWRGCSLWEAAGPGEGGR